MKELLTKIGAEQVFAKLHAKLNGERQGAQAVYDKPQPKFLYSQPYGSGAACPEQVAHYDYKMKQQSGQSNAASEVPPSNEDPMSCLIALHGDSTHLVLFRQFRDEQQGQFWHKIYVPLNPGDMVIWTGYMGHAGGRYLRDNVRLFSYLSTKNRKPTDSIQDINFGEMGVDFNNPGSYHPYDRDTGGVARLSSRSGVKAVLGDKSSGKKVGNKKARGNN
ncbi:hypothetical protein B484DRAFT_427558 [Ochromonadaceae sp. CCMP2298]|nr:hypothetical protein B484DRAFT_427558 [Ochromonadaceae sp. CCMP2298]